MRWAQFVVASAEVKKADSFLAVDAALAEAESSIALNADRLAADLFAAIPPVVAIRM